MQNPLVRNTTGLTSKGFEGMKVFGIRIASVLGIIVTYSMIQTNTLSSKLYRLQILKLNKEGIMEKESELNKAFDEIDALAGIYKAPILDDSAQTTPTPPTTVSADGGNAAAMVEGDVTKFLDEYQFVKDYAAPQIGGGFSATW